MYVCMYRKDILTLKTKLTLFGCLDSTMLFHSPSSFKKGFLFDGEL